MKTYSENPIYDRGSREWANDKKIYKLARYAGYTKEQAKAILKEAGTHFEARRPVGVEKAFEELLEAAGTGLSPNEDAIYVIHEIGLKLGFPEPELSCECMCCSRVIRPDKFNEGQRLCITCSMGRCENCHGLEEVTRQRARIPFENNPFVYPGQPSDDEALKEAVSMLKQLERVINSKRKGKGRKKLAFELLSRILDYELIALTYAPPEIAHTYQAIASEARSLIESRYSLPVGSPSPYKFPRFTPKTGPLPQWSERHKRLVEPDTRSPERIAKDEAIAQSVDLERALKPPAYQALPAPRPSMELPEPLETPIPEQHDKPESPPEGWAVDDPYRINPSYMANPPPTIVAGPFRSKRAASDALRRAVSKFGYPSSKLCIIGRHGQFYVKRAASWRGYDNPGRRIRLHEMQKYDYDNNTSDVRLLEMMVDGGATDQRVIYQFWRDVNTYGLREAFIYLKGYAEKGMWDGDLSQMKEHINMLLQRHGGQYLDNLPIIPPDDEDEEDNEIEEEPYA